MIILYFIIFVFPVIAIVLTALHIYLTGKEKQPIKHNLNYNQPYISSRTRGSVRQGIGKIKTMEDYFNLENQITFPKKHF